jgi:hypothetical protein
MNADGPHWVWDFPLHDSMNFQGKDRLKARLDLLLARDADNKNADFVPLSFIDYATLLIWTSKPPIIFYVKSGFNNLSLDIFYRQIDPLEMAHIQVNCCTHIFNGKTIFKTAPI